MAAGSRLSMRLSRCNHEFLLLPASLIFQACFSVNIFNPVKNEPGSPIALLNSPSDLCSLYRGMLITSRD